MAGHALTQVVVAGAGPGGRSPLAAILAFWGDGIASRREANVDRLFR